MAKKYFKIAAAWLKSKTNDKGTFEFTSIAFCGKGEKDQFEVILRDKQTKQEFALSNMGVSMIKNTFKKKENQPDFNINVSYEE